MKLSYLCAGILLLNLFACEQREPGWIPVMEQTSTSFLTDQVAQALQSLQAVKANLRSGERLRAEEDIRKLNTSLQHLKYYYLPMLQAREHVYNAYRLYYLKRQDEARDRLQEVKALLEGIADRGDEVLKEEMEKLVDQVSHVEEALRLRPRQAPARFQELLVGLNLRALRGELFLDEEDSSHGER